MFAKAQSSSIKKGAGESIIVLKWVHFLGSFLGLRFFLTSYGLKKLPSVFLPSFLEAVLETVRQKNDPFF